MQWVNSLADSRGIVQKTRPDPFALTPFTSAYNHDFDQDNPISLPCALTLCRCRRRLGIIAVGGLAVPDTLKPYKAKRNFGLTSEPVDGGGPGVDGLSFMI